MMLVVMLLTLCQVGRTVVILWGKHEGKEASLRSVDTAKFAAKLQLESGEKVGFCSYLLLPISYLLFSISYLLTSASYFPPPAIGAVTLRAVQQSLL